jgi:hypothetical protein
MLFLDGVYSSTGHPKWFRQVKAPSSAELTRLTHTIAQRVGRYLERQGLVERDTGNIFLTQDAVCASDEDPSNQNERNWNDCVDISQDQRYRQSGY